MNTDKTPFFKIAGWLILFSGHSAGFYLAFAEIPEDHSLRFAACMGLISFSFIAAIELHKIGYKKKEK